MRCATLPRLGYCVMKGWRWGILLFELFLFALILVLPQVDLPDFAFHRGTAPIIAKSQFSAPPVLTAVTVPTQSQPLKTFGNGEGQLLGLVSDAIPRSLLSLLCTLLC
jgi:hypothetical protein